MLCERRRLERPLSVTTQITRRRHKYWAYQELLSGGRISAIAEFKASSSPQEPPLGVGSAHRVRVKERLMAGDVTLLKLGCPKCQKEHLVGYPVPMLECCSLDLSGYVLDIGRRRLLCGTRRKRGLSLSKRLIAKLLALQGPYCAYCSVSFEETGYHVEHVVPVSVGGTNLISNLCLSCPRCNLVAGAWVFSSVEAKRNFILKRRGL